MGALDLTIQVYNISPEATEEDLITFFSYCGTIDEILLQSDGDNSQLAIVTFKQPYAVQTALLLNDAIILDRRVCILPLKHGTSVTIISCTSGNMNTERGGRSIPSTKPPAQATVLRGQEVLNRARDQLLDAGVVLTQQANTAMASAQQTMGSITSTIMGTDCVSKGALWLSGILDRASKGVAELGNAKIRNPNSRKQK